MAAILKFKMAANMATFLYLKEPNIALELIYMMTNKGDFHPGSQRKCRCIKKCGGEHVAAILDSKMAATLIPKPHFRR